MAEREPGQTRVRSESRSSHWALERRRLPKTIAARTALRPKTRRINAFNAQGTFNRFNIACILTLTKRGVLQYIVLRI